MNSGRSGTILFAAGFRPFFLAAGVFAILSIGLWAFVYILRFQFPLQSINSFQWHAHEMIYGYALAVIAGFLLTAVEDWTGIRTWHGKLLVLLIVLWLIARLLFAAGGIAIAGAFDMLFSVCLVLAVTHPVVKTKQWRQMAAVSKLSLLALGNLIFYLGALDLLDNGVRWGIYGGLYLILGLVLTVGRRVIPSFIEKDVGEDLRLFNSRWLDIGSLLFFFAFFVSEMLGRSPALSAWLALGVAVVSTARLSGWHTLGLWRNPLLWSLYLSLWLICLGFFLFAASYFAGISQFIPIHAMAFGGIGLMTLGMMSRVTLENTGGDVNRPPKPLGLAFTLLLVGTLFRVVLPLFSPAYYTLWIVLSQVFWVAAFAIFLVVFIPMFSFKPPNLEKS